MTKTEIVKLLTVLAALDKRTIGGADVEAWHLVLQNTPYEAAARAVVMLAQREPDKMIRPGHIWALTRGTSDVDRHLADELDRECEHGRLCASCYAIHKPEEPCAVLVRATPEITASIVDTFRTPTLEEKS